MSTVHKLTIDGLTVGVFDNADRAVEWYRAELMAEFPPHAYTVEINEIG